MTSTQELYAAMRTLAEGKLKCKCGNRDWRGFLFITGGPGQVVAGCKLCGSSYSHQNEHWEKIGGPAPHQGRAT